MKEIIREKNKQLELEKYARTGLNPEYYEKKINVTWSLEK